VVKALFCVLFGQSPLFHRLVHVLAFTAVVFTPFGLPAIRFAYWPFD